MCNRFKSPLQLVDIRELASLCDFQVRQEAEIFVPSADVRPSTETLMFWQANGIWQLGTGFWGFPKPPSMGKGLVINARSERIGASPFWRDAVPCWLPATCWIEYITEGRKNRPQTVGLPDGSPFLIAGVCAQIDGMRRMAMQMHDAPPRLAYLCDRLPIPIAFTSLGMNTPPQIMDQMIVAD